MEMAGNESSDTPASGTNSSLTNQQSRPPFKPTTGGLLTGSHSKGPPQRELSHRESPRKEIQPKCVYCTQSYWFDQCPNFPTLEARKKKLEGSCYNCLQKGHTLKDCMKDRVCAHCGSKKNHHGSLCNHLFQQDHEVQNISNVDKAEDATPACANQVLMQTASSTVKNPQADLTVSVRLLFDSGSQ